MSEVRSRPSGPRGRGSGRGARGGFNSRGRGGRANSGKADPADAPSFEEEGEIGELKSRYHSQLGTVKEMFPDWTDEDLVFALNETNGDLESTIDRITEGNMPQWGEVKKKTKDRYQPKQPKEAAASTTEASTPSTRGGRGRGGAESSRGGRGRGVDRGSERGRGATRGGRGVRTTSHPKTNGLGAGNKAQTDAIPADQAFGGWDTATTDTNITPLDSSWENVTAEQAQPPAQEEPKAAIKPDGSKTWASMFAKPKTAPPPKVQKSVPTHSAPDEPLTAPAVATDVVIQGLPLAVGLETSEAPMTPPTSDLATSEQIADLTPPKDDLTENNLEKLPDDSQPVSATAATTAASTVDQRVISGAPLGPSQQKSNRPPLGGFATSAYKATGMPGRTASYQRKILEQQEAVVMPEKHAVDKAAVQFGSMGLNGAPEDVDVDSDREDAETRAQPPQHSPVAPRASLPPVPEQKPGLPQTQHMEAQPAPRQAPGLPPVSLPPPSQQPPISSAPEAQLSSQAGYNYSQYGDRYGQPSTQPEVSAAPSKPYEPFGQQLQQSQHYDPFSNARYGGLSNEAQQYIESKSASGPSNPSSYYTSDEQRNAFQSSQYGSYGQQNQSGPESTPSQHRTSSAIGSSAPGQPSQQATAHGRFGQGAEAQGSGHSTPYGSMPNPQSANHPHGSGPGQQPYGYGGYPYGGYYSSYNMNQMGNHPYNRDRPTFDDARRYEDSYLSQSAAFNYTRQSQYGGGHFGGAGGKGVYGQQHASYGMSPQTSHEQHSASPANAGAFGQQLPASGRDSAAGGLSSYGARSGSTQPADNLHSSNQGNMPDVFGRSTSNFQGQNQGLGSGNEDPLRVYGESKVAGGPSPALGQSGGRPGSAVNPQTGLPPQDARFQQNYGGYPSHSQYGGGPTASGHGSAAQSHQYGQYGAAGNYGGNYYGSNNRGNWGANYGH